MLVDSHVHLNDEAFASDFSKAIAEAKENGVTMMLIPGWDLASSRLARDIARKFDGVYFAAGIQPENITSSIHMAKVQFINAGVYRWFHHYVYRHCSHIHCPSNFIAGELKRRGYTEQLHVISNGIDPDFVYRKLPKTDQFAGKFVILMMTMKMMTTTNKEPFTHLIPTLPYFCGPAFAT